MRGVWAAIAVLWLGGAGGAAAHGGGGVHYIIISVPLPGRPARASDLVEIPMEITDAPPAQAAGVLGRGQVIGVHTLRALESVVLLEPVQGRGGEIPAGRVLTQVVVHHKDARQVVYCDLNIAPGRRGLYKWDCFDDSQGAGRLDGLWEGRAGDAFMGFSTDAAEMNWKHKLAQPAAYRRALPQERSTGEIGYAWCGGDAVNSPPRFSVSGHWSQDFFESAEADACAFGAWADPTARGLVLIDRIKATITPGAQPRTLAYRLEARIPPGPIAHLGPNSGIVAKESADAEAARQVEELKDPPFVAAGAPPTTVTGAVAKGRAFYTLGVRHSLTGVLTNDVHTGTYALLVGGPARPRAGLAPGQILYGARVGGAIEPQIVWCAPMKAADGTWPSAVCLPNDGVGTQYLSASPAMMGAAHLVLAGQTPPYAAGPIVDRRDVALPPLTLAYGFSGWRRGALEVALTLDWGEGPQALQTRTVPADAVGVFHVPVMGGEVLATASPEDSGAITVLKFTAAPAAPAAPTF